MNSTLEFALETGLTLGGRCTRLMADGFVMVFPDNSSKKLFRELTEGLDVNVTDLENSVVVTA